MSVNLQCIVYGQNCCSISLVRRLNRVAAFDIVFVGSGSSLIEFVGLGLSVPAAFFFFEGLREGLGVSETDSCGWEDRSSSLREFSPTRLTPDGSSIKAFDRYPASLAYSCLLGSKPIYMSFIFWSRISCSNCTSSLDSYEYLSRTRPSLLQTSRFGIFMGSSRTK